MAFIRFNGVLAMVHELVIIQWIFKAHGSWLSARQQQTIVWGWQMLFLHSPVVKSDFETELHHQTQQKLNQSQIIIK